MQKVARWLLLECGVDSEGGDNDDLAGSPRNPIVVSGDSAPDSDWSFVDVHYP